MTTTYTSLFVIIIRDTRNCRAQQTSKQQSKQATEQTSKQQSNEQATEQRTSNNNTNNNNNNDATTTFECEYYNDTFVIIDNVNDDYITSYIESLLL